MPLAPIFFASQAELRAWFEQHHADEKELLAGFYKVSAKRPSLTWAQSVDEALCFGWIDGKGSRIDDDSYSIRFTPRKKSSVWSTRNIKRMQELIALGQMRPAGLRVFEERDEKKVNMYAYENNHETFDAEREAKFEEHPAAWAFFQAQPPAYRKAAIWWVISAKQDKTRESRLAKLIEHSTNNERLPMLVSPTKKKKDEKAD